MKKDNIKVSTFAFIAFSLSAFAVVSFLYIFLSAQTHYTYADKKVYEIEEVYLNETYNSDDPYLTKANSLKNIIDGPIISNYDPYLGSFDASVKVIVYSDFTCPYCLEQEKIVKEVLQKYGDKVRFIWKDYPESDLDSLSLKVAIAARCSQDQDLFWEFHDKLFEHSPLMGEGVIYKIRDEIPLVKDEFNDCYDNNKSLSLVLNNIEEANAIGIVGVPSVYINDKEFIGNVSLEDFSLVIDSFLKDE